MIWSGNHIFNLKSLSTVTISTNSSARCEMQLVRVNLLYDLWRPQITLLYYNLPTEKVPELPLS